MCSLSYQMEGVDENRCLHADTINNSTWFACSQSPYSQGPPFIFMLNGRYAVGSVRRLPTRASSCDWSPRNQCRHVRERRMRRRSQYVHSRMQCRTQLAASTSGLFLTTKRFATLSARGTP